MSFLDILNRAGGFLSKNPSLLPMGLNLLATDAAMRAPSYDPGASQRAFAQGMGNIGNTWMAGQQYQAQQEARKQAEELARRRQEIMEAQFGMARSKYDREVGREQRYGQAVDQMFPVAEAARPQPDAVGPMPGVQPPMAGVMKSLGPQAGSSALLNMMNAPQYQPVQNPLGLGGVGLMNPKTGELKNYQRPDNQLVEVFDPDSPTQTRLVPRSEAVNMYGKPPSNALSLQTTPEGAVNLRMGREMKLGQKAQGDVEQKLLDATSGLMRITEIEKNFKPEYQEWSTRRQAWWTAMKEKAGADVSEEDKKNLGEFSVYKKNAIENINRYIKEITGSQMAEAEAARIRQGMPDPGESVFDGDSPTEFKAKMTDTIKKLKMSVARYHYIQRNGLSLNSVGIDRMPKIIQQRGDALMEQFRNSGVTDESLLKQQVMQRLAQEFGLVQ